MNTKSNSIIFLIRSLGCGGAERQLVTLAKGLVARGRPVAVMVFYKGGILEAELNDAGVRLINLNKKGRWDVLLFWGRLVVLLWKEKPAVLHAYLTVPNLLSVLLKPLLPPTRVVWGLRASNMDLSHYDRLSRLSSFMECRLSRFADLIIANSYAGKLYAVEKGFPENKMSVVPNGIDISYFQFNRQDRHRLRSEWGVGEHDVLVGLIARLDPMKGHGVFLEAASLVVQERSDVRFVCVGEGDAGYTRKLKRLARALGLDDKLLWTGSRDDLPSLYSAFDVGVSASAFGEGFSNTIAEAMACGVVCVVTDVGDSARIVGDIGIVVPIADAQKLKDGLMELLCLPEEQRRLLGHKAHGRIRAEFGVDTLIFRTEQALGWVL